MSPSVPQIFSEQRRGARLARALARQARPGVARWLAEALAEDALERLGFLRWEGERVLVSGLGGELVAGGLGLPPPAGALELTQPIAGGPYDLIVSLAELDTVNDLPGALIHLRHALAPGGLLLASFPGAGSLPKLRQALLAGDGDRVAARLHPQIESRAASALMQRAGFHRHVGDQHTLSARYHTLHRLVSDLRDQGLTSVLADRAPILGKQALGVAEVAFAAQAEPDGKTSERFEIITLTAWKD